MTSWLHVPLTRCSHHRCTVQDALVYTLLGQVPLHSDRFLVPTPGSLAKRMVLGTEGRAGHFIDATFACSGPFCG